MNRNAIMEVVSERFKKIELSELSERLKTIGLPYAPINRPQDLAQDPHLLESGGLLNVGFGEGEFANLPALPLEFTDQRFGLRHNIASAGQHTKEVLGSLGYSEQNIDELLADKVAG